VVEEDYAAALHPHHVHVTMLGSPWCCTCYQNTTEQTHFAMLVAANKQMKNTTEWTHSAMLVVADELTKARNKAGVGLH